MAQEEKTDISFEYEADEEEPLIKKKQEPLSPMPKKRQKERSYRVVDPQAKLEKLKQELKAAKPQKKRKLMQESIPMRNTMEELFEQHKLHNQGTRMGEEEKAQEAP